MSRFASTARLLAGGIAAAFTVASASAQTASPPDLSSNFTSWAAGVGVDFTPVEGSPSPLRQDPAHPFVPNGTGRQPTYRIADLSNPNLKQWAKDIMKKDNDEVIAGKIADMKARRAAAGRPPMIFGMAAYAIVRETEDEAKAEVARITTLDPTAPGFANFEQWISGTELERELKLQEYSVSNRGLRPGLIGTSAQVRARIAAYEAAGLDLLLLQMSPQYEEMERFAAEVIAPAQREAALA